MTNFTPFTIASFLLLLNNSLDKGKQDSNVQISPPLPLLKMFYCCISFNLDKDNHVHIATQEQQANKILVKQEKLGRV